VANVKHKSQTTAGLGSFRLSRPQDSGVLAMVVAAALISWFAITNHNPAPAISRVAPVPAELSAPATTTPAAASGGQGTSLVIKAVTLTAERLKARTASLGQPVYWAGAVPGARYELSRSRAGNVLIRYLPPGVEAGQPGQFLTVGTYPFLHAFTTAQAAMQQPGIRSQQLAGGGLASYREAQPTSIYLAFPNIDYRIQVYDPSPAEARGLVGSGRVQRVG
jgi:hypothetical protein